MLPNFLQKYSNEEIDLIERLGYVSSSLDSYGNALLTSGNISVSSSLITVSIENPIYIESQIETLYDVEFTEFTVDTDGVQDNLKQEVETYKNLYNNTIQEKDKLASQLSSSLSSTDTSNKNVSDDMANRQIIVELRIKLGEGTDESQFEKYFPYLKIIDSPENI